MKVTLINYSFWPTLNVGLASLIASLASHGHEVSLIDLVFTLADGIPTKVRQGVQRESSDAVCIATNFNCHGLLGLITLLREWSPEVPIIVGQMNHTLHPFPESQPEAILEGVWIFEGDSWTFTGRADGAVLRILQDIEKGCLPGKMVRQPLPDLNVLPVPDYRLFDMPRYFKSSMILEGHLPIYASRGCPHRCNFCTISQTPYQHKEPQTVLDEILLQESRHRKDGMRSLGFGDPTFGLHNGAFREMMRLFRENGLGERMTWFCLTRPEVVTKEWANLAAVAGCQLVQLGVESCHPQVRENLLNKGFTDAVLHDATTNLKDAGILYNFTMMAGVPRTSMLSDVTSLLKAESYNPCCINLTHYRPYMSAGGDDKGSSNHTSGGERMREGFTALLQASSVPRNIIKATAQHGIPYLQEAVRYVMNRDGRRVLPLTHPLMSHMVIKRPIFNLYRNEYLHGKASRRDTSP